MVVVQFRIIIFAYAHHAASTCHDAQNGRLCIVQVDLVRIGWNLHLEGPEQTRASATDVVAILISRLIRVLLLLTCHLINIKIQLPLRTAINVKCIFQSDPYHVCNQLFDGDLIHVQCWGVFLVMHSVESERESRMSQGELV